MTEIKPAEEQHTFQGRGKGRRRETCWIWADGHVGVCFHQNLQLSGQPLFGPGFICLVLFAWFYIRLDVSLLRLNKNLFLFVYINASQVHN
ncbi:MAG: hypothetical protein P4N60_13985 [Verrucomicrobiae bacterium]|nr:hypothetical protein [Verrucomicrobiae bacterium]